MFRMCLVAILGKIYQYGEIPGRPDSEVLEFPRGVSEEIVLASIFGLVACSNIQVPYDNRIYATDASMQKGAVVSRRVPMHVAEAAWLGGDKRGAYRKLDNPYRSALRLLGEEDFGWASLSAQSGCKDSFPVWFLWCGGSGVVSAAASKTGLTVMPPIELSDLIFGRFVCLSGYPICCRLESWRALSANHRALLSHLPHIHVYAAIRSHWVFAGLVQRPCWATCWPLDASCCSSLQSTETQPTWAAFSEQDGLVEHLAFSPEAPLCWVIHCLVRFWFPASEEVQAVVLWSKEGTMSESKEPWQRSQQFMYQDWQIGLRLFLRRQWGRPSLHLILWKGSLHWVGCLEWSAYDWCLGCWFGVVLEEEVAH